jgi:hypothetical protein
VVHDPRDRQEFYDQILPFASWLDEEFNRWADDRDVRTNDTGKVVSSVARHAPQLIVPNAASAQLLGKVGRRLAYLGASKFSIDPLLITAGRHLLFLREHLRVAGQQLVVPLAQLLADHWATPQTAAERLSVPALEAWINPPSGIHGFLAAVAAEVAVNVGPVPPGAHDEALFDLVSQRRKAKKRGDAASIARAEAEIEARWCDLMRPAWDLCWDSLDRERTWTEAPSVARRWTADRRDFSAHIDWQRAAGRRRLRPTPRQAAITQSRLEQSLSTLITEEATDDPLRMLPLVLRNEALIGDVVRVDTTNRELSEKGQTRTYPLVTVECSHACAMRPGKELWWAAAPGDSSWLVREVSATAAGTTLITLRRSSSVTKNSRLPAVGATEAFSILFTKNYEPLFPKEADVPWTHRRTDDSESPDLDAGSTGVEPNPVDAPTDTIEVIEFRDRGDVE